MFSGVFSGYVSRMAKESDSNISGLPITLPGRGGKPCTPGWVPLLMPHGISPKPSPMEMSFGPAMGSSTQRRQKLSESFKPAGRFDPAMSVTEFEDGEYRQELDRAWRYDELPEMADEARYVLSRTGFVPRCSQHFIAQDSSGLWFIFADKDLEVWVDLAVEQEDVSVALGDPPAFEDLPGELRDLSGGPYSHLAWAMEVLKAATTKRRLASVAGKAAQGDGLLANAFREGDSAAAAKHIEWLLEGAASKAWEQGGFFRAVQVSDLVAEGHVRAHREGAMASARSVAKKQRSVALSRFIQEQDAEGRESNMEIARRAWRAKAAGELIFSGVSLIAHDELAREVAALRAGAATPRSGDHLQLVSVNGKRSRGT